jgi:hypothetical protein
MMTDDIEESSEDDDISEDSGAVSIDEEQVEQERIMLRKQLANMKERRADLSEHCEGETDIEDLYDMKENNSGVVKEGLDKGTKAVAIQDENNTTSDPKGKCKATEEDCRYLSDNSLLNSEDDDRAVENIVQKKTARKWQPKKPKLTRMWFNEANMLDPSQLCKAFASLIWGSLGGL